LISVLTKFNNLTQRLITGILGSAVIIFCIVYSDWTYFLIFFIVCLLSLLEFYRLSGTDGLLPQKIFGTVCGMMLFCLSFFIERGDLLSHFYFLMFPVLSFIFIIPLYRKSERKPFTNIAFTFLGIFYVGVPFALLNAAVFEHGVYNYQIIWGCLFILWASDTGAYFAGTYLGRKKLFERISPKKTWEGAIGGAALALVFALGIAHYFTSLALWQWVTICALIVIGGTFGDLIESLLKRSIEIKDSGNAIPGHGGFLDRFDGLFISAPFIVAFLKIF
jgi:phosphatidate cytidylyltransferase